MRIFITPYSCSVDPQFHHAHFAAASCKNEFLLHNLVVSARAQLLFYTGKIWLILWLWKQILVKHQFPVLSVLTIFKDRSVVVPQYPEPFLQSAQSSQLLFYVTHWTCDLPLFHKLGYTRLCGNWQVRILMTKLTDTFSKFLSLQKFWQ
jgi:hypothetical protein